MIHRPHLLPAAHTHASPWWTNAVLYQIYPRSFQDTNGDGFGDLEGIRQRLDYLADLGIDIVWICPIYRSPQADNGYDIADYRDIDPLFGDLDAFDRLIARAHELGMRVVMDLVVNHTSIEHPWFVESASSVHSARRDWYYWRDARPGMQPGAAGAEPNNWESFFGGSAWQYDPNSGQYYLHLFAREQPDLNWENPQVRDAVYDMMNWWLDRGVDGFRVDAIDVISKAPGLPDGGPARPPFGVGHECYADGPRLHEFLQEMNSRTFAHHPGSFTVGEASNASAESALLFCAPDRGEFNMLIQFEHVNLGSKTASLRLAPCRTESWPTCSLAGRTRSESEGGTLSTWRTTTSRDRYHASVIPQPIGASRPRPWPLRTSCSAARPSSTRARKSECSEERYRRVPISATSSP